MAQCQTPFSKQCEKTGNMLSLPCGKCPECYARRISAWSFRLRKQGQISETAHFITLTYNTNTVPISKHGFMTLDKTDIQKFVKRLRKMHTENTKISYYVCGEYGTKTKRPHYHAIIFNADINDIENAWKLNNEPLGDIHCGDVSGASIGYTLKYMCKPKQIPQHQNDDRQKEFSLMSKKLGSNYLTTEMVQWHQNDLLNRMYVPIEEGKKIAMPRYYKQKIYTDVQRQKIGKHISKITDIETEKTIKQIGEHEYFTKQINTLTKGIKKLQKTRLTETI